MSWSISVKTVGNTQNVHSNNNNNSNAITSNNKNKQQLKDFTIQVEPNEVISTLHRKIEAVTGLKSSQQRLIYRGRLISSGCPTPVGGNADSAAAGTPSSNSPSTLNHSNGDVSSTRTTNPNTNTNTNTTGQDGVNNNTAISNDSEEEPSHVDLDTAANENHSLPTNDSNGQSNLNPSQPTTSPTIPTAAAAAAAAAGRVETEPVTESRICDVVGLSDGQTIHLVPRPHHDSPTLASATSTSAATSNANASNPTNNDSSMDDNESSNNDNASNGGSGSSSSSSPSGGAGLLAALLGLGSSTTNNNSNNNQNNRNNTTNNNEDENDAIDSLEAALSAPPRFRSSTTNTANNAATSGNSSSSRRRMPHSYRRLENDPLYPNPCSLEPVRQGLMTLHTMIGEDVINGNNNNSDDNNNKVEVEKNTDYNETGSKPKSTTSSSSNTQKMEESMKSPLNFRRKWYIGQWLDCRDTVNQWLEATVTEIVYPHDLIQSVPSSTKTQTTSIHNDEYDHDNDDVISNNHDEKHNHPITKPYIDPAIGANDLDGRTKLLLEPSPDENDTTLSSYNNNDESLIGYQERKHNHNIQLLKIHYNGWPHRWDEWIRSDSERIRPFRTRSKHIPNLNHVNPSPQSLYRESPATFITSEEDEMDRLDVLPELFCAIDTVQSIFEDAATTNNTTTTTRRHYRKSKVGYYDHMTNNEEDDGDVSIHTIVPLTKEEQEELSNCLRDLPPEKEERVMNIIDKNEEGMGSGKSMDIADILVEELDEDVQHNLFCYLLRPGNSSSSIIQTTTSLKDTKLPWRGNKSTTTTSSSSSSTNYDDLPDDERTQAMELKLKQLNKEKLEALAPLLDRLGRVLIDFAPHVASIADSIPETSVTAEPQQDSRDGELETVAESNESSSHEGDVTASTSFSNSFMPLRPSWSLNRDTTNESTTPLLSATDNNSTNNESNDDEEDTNNQIDPDYVDFVNGFIYPAARVEAPPRRAVRRSNSDNFGSSLLSAFLSSNTGGTNSNDDDEGNGPRILRLGGSTNGGGNGNGGIDIHIHAIVTGPNGGGIAGAGGLDGIAGLMSPPTATTTTTSAPSIVNNNSNANTGATRASVQNVDDDEEELGLFSDLYAEPGQNQTNNTSSNNLMPYDPEVEIEDELDNVPHLLNDDEPQHNGVMSTSMDSAGGEAGANRQDTNARRPSSSNSAGSSSSRRGQMFGRIFRRALSRRNDGNNH